MTHTDEKTCKCGQVFLAVEREVQCGGCDGQSRVKRLIFVYHGVVLSFLVPIDKRRVFIDILRENGAAQLDYNAGDFK